MTKKKPKLPPLIDVPGRPGFSLINRYLPGASDAEKEEAYENLKSLVATLHQIDEHVHASPSADVGLS